MIYKNNKNTVGVYQGNKVISAVYKGSRLVWQAVRSCYGRGIWIQDKPWIDGDTWKDNK